MLRLYLGAAPGVGKTFSMLDEGWRRSQRGTDVVVGYVETHNRPKTSAQIRDLEVIPRTKIEYRDATFEEMDTEAILARHPDVVLVDELAHTNVPGSGHEKRWQDVEDLLSAGITVISTVNIQHLESLNDVVQRITGVVQRETIPDSVARSADQIELVDMTPEALRRRMAHGNIYAADKVDGALAHYFRLGNLTALRELALLWVADRVEENLHDYRERHGIEEPWETKERVVVALTGAAGGDDLIRRGARMAARLKTELVGVTVRASDGLAGAPAELLDQHRHLLVELGGRYAEITGTDVAETLVEFARAENATQLILGSSHRSRWSELAQGSVINRVIKAAGSGGIDIHIMSSGKATTGGALPRLGRRPATALSRRRRFIGMVLAAGGIPMLGAALTFFRGTVGVPGVLLLLLLGTIGVATVGGMYPAALAVIIGFLFADWFFIPPLHSFTILRGSDLTTLVVFIAVAVVVSTLVDRLARRGVQVARASAEAEALARLAGGAVLSSRGALPSLVGSLRTTFNLDAVAVLVPVNGGWRPEVASGGPVPESPDKAPFSAELAAGSVLVLSGAQLGPEDRRLLAAFVAQLRLAQETARLETEAASAEALADANKLRTALLAAVSHDLRTPLASIKASATSLLAKDVVWSPDDVHVFSKTIDEEADRLNALVGNLLDMSRLQTGALSLSLRPVGLDEVVFAALESISRDASAVAVEVSEEPLFVLADPALLERAIANIVDNALAWSPPEATVRVAACAIGDVMTLRVVDQGRGIPPSQRDAVFEPFQRRGDGTANIHGVGLGLAVAKGFVEAMGGEVTIDDTPGGGATIAISLPVHQPPAEP